MKRFNVRYAETFLWDMIDITLYLLDKTESVAVSKRFYDKALQFIEERSYGADSYEPYYPYEDSPDSLATNNLQLRQLDCHEGRLELQSKGEFVN